MPLPDSLLDIPDASAVARGINARFNRPVVRVGTAGAERTLAVSTGFPALDAATGWGGFPRGHVTELIGRPTSGRTSVAARAVARAEGYCAWVDVASLLDVDACARAGINLERLFIVRPQQPGDAPAITVQLATGGHFTLVVLDSLADLAPGGPTARVAGQLVRVVTPRLAGTPTALLVLTSPDQTIRPLAHTAALRIAFMQVGLLRRGGVLRGWRVQAAILKSRGNPRQEVGLEVWH